MSGEHDLAATLVDLAATAGLAGLGWVTGAWWWWLLAAAWGLIAVRQARLTRRAAAYRRHTR